MNIRLGLSLIAMERTEPESERVILQAHEQKIVNGWCSLILNRGSFDMMSAFDDNSVEINKGLIKTSYVSIIAGESGCDMTLIRTSPQKKF